MTSVLVDGRINPEHVQNAALSGAVAIGAACSLPVRVAPLVAHRFHAGCPVGAASRGLRGLRDKGSSAPHELFREHTFCSSVHIKIDPCGECACASLWIRMMRAPVHPTLSAVPLAAPRYACAAALVCVHACAAAPVCACVCTCVHVRACAAARACVCVRVCTRMRSSPAIVLLASALLAPHPLPLVLALLQCVCMAQPLPAVDASRKPFGHVDPLPAKGPRPARRGLEATQSLCQQFGCRGASG